jgi:hypothetical protein
MRTVLFLLLAAAVIYDLASDESHQAPIEMITSSPLLDASLMKHASEIHEFTAYRNHVYRVLSYTMYMLQASSAALPREEIVHDIIRYHHKVTPFVGSNADVVNAVRLADWIDASGGVFKCGISRANIRRAYQALPSEGFYWFLLTYGFKIHPWNPLRAAFELSRIVYW